METMVDIEALGHQPDGAIVAIGAVSFDPARRIIDTKNTFYERVSLESSMYYGMKADASTIVWWLQQPEEARRELTHRGENLHVALSRFLFWRGQRNNWEIWAHGTTYDITILETAYRLVSLPTPWKYREINDTRQLFRMAGVDYHGTAHHALQDALSQAEAVIRAYDVLGNRKEGPI